MAARYSRMGRPLRCSTIRSTSARRKSSASESAAEIACRGCRRAMNLPTIFENLLPGAATTLIVATGAWACAAVLGLVVDMVRHLAIGPLGWGFDLVTTTLRSMPQLVVIYVFYFGLGAVGIDLGSIPSAILALGLTEAAFMAEYYRSGWLTVPEQQSEAGLSLGLSPSQVFRRVVIPQTVPF